MDKKNKKISVMALGLRGFPGVQGGIQKHCEHLYPLMDPAKVNVEAIVRSPYMKGYQSSEWKGVRLRRLWSPKIKSLEAIIHSTLGVFIAAFSRPDVLHIHGIGPALVTPLARLMGLRVVMTHHGPDYDRQKWGKFAKWSLRMGEYVGVRFSHRRIVISNVIQELVKDCYGKDSELIPNGVEPTQILASTSTISNFDLEPGRYLLMVGRFVPEKRQMDVIRSFAAAGIKGWKLALVGESNHPDQYMHDVINLAEATAGVVCTGFQTGNNLAELFSHAGGFVLASSHEGHSVALLEALSYGLSVIVSDIPANKEVGLSSECYYPLGDINELARKIIKLTDQEMTEAEKTKVQSWVKSQYNWQDIAQSTLSVFESVADGKRNYNF